MVWLREQGVGAIVSLTEKSLRQEKLLLHWIDSLDFAYQHIPIQDQTAPTQKPIDDSIGFVDAMVDQGRAVLVHCRGGYGRTGTMLACYLVSRGLNAEQAFLKVRARRPGSIMPEDQQQCIYEFAARFF